MLQFAFDGHSDNPYLPHNYVPNTVVYTGTHDNNTTRGWFEELPDDQRQNLWRYLKRPAGNGDMAAPALMDLAWSSAAALAMAPLQDLLNLGRRGPDERARSRRRQLALALHGGHAVRVRLSVAAGPDGNVKPIGFSADGSLIYPVYSGGNTMKATERLHNLGQSLWLDNITRDLLTTGRSSATSTSSR